MGQIPSPRVFFLFGAWISVRLAPPLGPKDSLLQSSSHSPVYFHLVQLTAYIIKEPSINSGTCRHQSQQDRSFEAPSLIKQSKQSFAWPNRQTHLCPLPLTEHQNESPQRNSIIPDCWIGLPHHCDTMAADPSGYAARVICESKTVVESSRKGVQEAVVRA